MVVTSVGDANVVVAHVADAKVVVAFVINANDGVQLNAAAEGVQPLAAAVPMPLAKPMSLDASV